jgi:hypothetical protein
MTNMNLRPEIVRGSDRVTYRSRIEFRPGVGAQGLLDDLRRKQMKQVIWDDEQCERPDLRVIFERGECYPSDDGVDLAIMDLFYFGALQEEQTVQMRHDAMVPAHLRLLRDLNGYSRLL